MSAEQKTANTGPDRKRDPGTIITHHLGAPEDTIRCASARALGALGDASAAPALVAALLDEDPDVRTDAMDALVHGARPEDGVAILESLVGDPVKEVKQAAIEALAALRHAPAIPLLRGLAINRCSEQVAWEDEDGLWDDWLDIQNAAITALGTLDVSDAIPDLLAARTDEMGQDIDHVLLDALANMPSGGLHALIDIATGNEGRLRARALSALEKAPGDLIAPLAGALAQDDSADVRRIAIPHLQAHDLMVQELVVDDPDPMIRREAIAHFGTVRPDLALGALSDHDEIVRALALDAIGVDTQVEDSLRTDLLANLDVWLTKAGTRLAAACVRALARLGTPDAGERLDQIAGDRAIATEVRLAAIATLADLPDEGVSASLAIHCDDPVQQVRAGALAGLAARAHHDDAAIGTLAAAIDGRGDDDAEIVDDSVIGEDEQQGAAASRVENAPSRLHITPDGEVVEGDPAESYPTASEPGDDGQPQSAEIIPFPTSTLAALQAWRPEREALDGNGDGGDVTTSDETGDAADERPERRKPRRRRVAVEGPSDPRVDQSLIAMRVAASLPDPLIEAALVSAARASQSEAGKQGHKLAALTALAKRSETLMLSGDALEALEAGLADEDAHCRGFAAMAIAGSGTEDGCDPTPADTERRAQLLTPLLSDDDPTVRQAATAAVGRFSPEHVRDACGDPAPGVRGAAMQTISTSAAADMPLLDGAIDAALAAHAADTLAIALSGSDIARDCILDRLQAPDTPRRDVLLLLQATAKSPIKANAAIS
ncbi:MAG: HEAT repeat domain-containing protein [Pseudomonadota bacterium]